MRTRWGIAAAVSLVLLAAGCTDVEAGSAKPAPNLAPFQRVQPLIPLGETNLPTVAGASASRAMDFSDADRTPEMLLNQIIWQSVKGTGSPVPPPRRSIMVRPGDKRDDDD